MSLVEKSNPVLRTKTERFDFNNPPIDPYQLYKELGETLIEKEGLGLAAPQIGYSCRAFVIRSSPIIGFFNPIIADVSDEVVEMEEGCLTFPGIVLKIQRPRVIKVRYADPTGKVETKQFQDMTARVIQHEVDHLDGIIFGARVGDMQLEMAIKKARKAGYNYVKSDLR